MLQLPMLQRERIIHVILFVSLVCLPFQIPAEEPGYRYFSVGHPSTGVASKISRGYALMGGGQDQDAAFQWMCDRAGGGDFVVLRASGTDAYNSYIRNLCPALSSVETLIITSRQGAGQPFVVEKIRTAAAVFIAGGSQDNYINFWKGTQVEETINSAIKNGVPAGGTSAGLAVLGEYSFAALKDTVKSSEALPNPFHEKVTITRDFLHVPLLDSTITDSHFVARDRMGRLITFLARIATDGWTASADGDRYRRKDRGSSGCRWHRAGNRRGRRLFSSHSRLARAMRAACRAYVQEYLGVPTDGGVGTVQREILDWSRRFGIQAIGGKRRTQVFSPRQSDLLKIRSLTLAAPVECYRAATVRASVP